MSRHFVLGRFRRLAVCLLPLVCGASGHSQQSLTWDDVKAHFEAQNPQLKADQNGVEELRAAEITAFLRPNPQMTLTADGTQIAPHEGVWRPTSGTQVSPNVSYLHERDHKRELRLKSAQEGTSIGVSQHVDLDRNLTFRLRAAFVATLQAKEGLQLAKDNLEYYDKLIEKSQDRFNAGAIAQIDLDRIELLRVQYEAQLEAAIVSLRTQKITLLQLLNEQRSIEQFDITGPFDFSRDLRPLEEFRHLALDSRPDLRAAIQSIEQARTNRELAVSNGSTDPTLAAWYTYNPSFYNPYAHQTLGLSVNIPLRIFDRNQGEKQRTLIDIDRNVRLSEVARAQVFSDVDSAYEQVRSNIALLIPYKDKYRDQATRVRDTVSYAYQRGGASLMDFLNAQSDYRVVQQAYLQLVGAYLTATSQLNFAVGREVIP